MSEASPKKRQAYRAGLWAETLAALFLMAKGYRITARRYRCAQGEIDLIATRKSEIVFVEVKRRASLAEAAHAIEPRQRVRIHKAAQSYLTQVGAPANVRARFDAILVAPWCRIEHRPNAWQ